MTPHSVRITPPQRRALPAEPVGCVVAHSEATHLGSSAEILVTMGSDCKAVVTAGRRVEMTTPPEEYETIFVAYITTKSGRRIYARERGLKGFPIRVRRKPAK